MITGTYNFFLGLGIWMAWGLHYIRVSRDGAPILDPRTRP